MGWNDRYIDIIRQGRKKSAEVTDVPKVVKKPKKGKVPKEAK